jgi:hypothetical protein
VTAALAVVAVGLAGCQHPIADGSSLPAPKVALASSNQPPSTVVSTSTNRVSGNGKRYNYTPRPYPVDDRGFTPVDQALANACAREELVTEDADGSLNPYVLKVISAYPLDGSDPYHCSWKPREYHIYNGVTQDLWYRGMVVPP